MTPAAARLVEIIDESGVSARAGDLVISSAAGLTGTASCTLPRALTSARP